ncbi:MAG TPA: hypothetical protein DCY13_12575 [Verrucomicrobiales bacterium]|nr:hypothetical protein [Verrucomicrobiales bacterium]
MILRWLVLLAVLPLRAWPDQITLLSWNVAGNGANDWTTNSAQVQAIGRIVRHLQPDIVTLQEIPHPHVSEMTNFIKAYLPQHELARASGTDGSIRSVIASRFPINRQQKWLDGELLNAFGYDGRFTRDLFEAEIAVPGWPQPLHVFTTHLKSMFDADSVARRSAEALAISNFVVHVFYPSWTNQPFVLTGDFNEDHVVHAASGAGVVAKLTHPAVGLHLATPRNPSTGSERTFSIRTSLQSRLDYVLPNGQLHSNIITSQIFRTGNLHPLPPGLLTNDDRTASDHLPVLMVFGNPYPQSFRVTRIELSGDLLSLRWDSKPGRRYNVESSSDLVTWSTNATDLLVGGTNAIWNTAAPGGSRYYRIRMNP